MTADPTVDVIIPVHSEVRPIARAVASVLDGTSEPVRVSIVCHNIQPQLIRASLGPWADDARVRLLELADGIPSPAGPINYGLGAATGSFTCLLDSDDTYEFGAIDSWMRHQRSTGADIVMATLKYAAGGRVRTPVRPFRSRGLDGVRDRLAYRTRQHGLVSSKRFPDLRLTAGLRTGEDIEQGLTLWFSDARISFDRRGPGYLIHEDFGDRASVSAKTVAEDFGFLDTILAPDFAPADPRARESIAIKQLRTHLMEALVARLIGTRRLADDERLALARVVDRIHEFSPTAASVLSVRDRRIITWARAGLVDDEARLADLAARKDYRRPQNLLSASPRLMLHREAPLRFLAATAVAV